MFYPLNQYFIKFFTLLVCLYLIVGTNLSAQDYTNNLPTCGPGQSLIQIACGKLGGSTCFSCGYCGDGITDNNSGEECDIGMGNTEEGVCRNCKIPACGDGIHNEFDEDIEPKWTCDYIADTDCREDCTKCGDEVKNADEECDPTITDPNNPDYVEFCRDTCKVMICGDDILDTASGETCEVSDSDCRSDCTKCGDNLVQAGYEECDGADTPAGEFCRNTCELAVCGDNIVDAQTGETCEVNDPTCRKDCTRCGDGVINHPSEECDGSGVIWSGKKKYKCTAECALIRIPRCGDRIIDRGEECDGGANCTNHCTISKCASSRSPGINNYNPCLRGHCWAIRCSRRNSPANHNPALHSNAGASYGLVHGADGCWDCSARRTRACFAPDTKILMSDGSYKEINNIYAGELVFNPITHKNVKVLDRIDDFEDHPLIGIKANGNLIKVTRGHPVLTQNGFKKAIDITKDDYIYFSKDEIFPVEEVLTLDHSQREHIVNIALEYGSGDPEVDNVLIAEGMIVGDSILQGLLSEKEN